jgi:hypothetical protein
MNNKHQGISGYSYSSELCYSCHPTGDGEGAFNHSLSNFPLTGAHTTVTCSQCHSSGYAGTTTVCYDCHQSNYNTASNPNHQSLSISTDCSSCHSTNADWKPATFAIHNNYYAIVGAHTAIANDCNACHNGNYNNAPNTCYGCHQDRYNATTNPNHQSAGFPTECTDCHSQNAWEPSTFNHDNQFFPIYSGKHREKWDACSDCHTNSSNFSVFSCITCHEHNQSEMNDKHSEVSGYEYNSDACFDCHPRGDGDLRIRNLRRMDR